MKFGIFGLGGGEGLDGGFEFFEINGFSNLEYLKNLRENLPCLIILDLNMPRMNGFEFLKEVKKDEKLCMIPVVVLTTSDNHRDIIDSYTLGCAGYIIKPIDYTIFVENIKALKNYWLINQLPN